MSFSDSVGFSSSSSKKKSSPTPSYYPEVQLSPEQQEKKRITNIKLGLKSSAIWSIILTVLLILVVVLVPAEDEITYTDKQTKLKVTEKQPNTFFYVFVVILSIALLIALVSLISVALEYKKL
jgi:NADH:ubiquinone oxidoreductase subunit 6 (subunit J)